MTSKRGLLIGCALLVVGSALMLSQGYSKTSQTIPHLHPRLVADYLHAVIEADRTVYTTHVVNRLQNQGIIMAAEDWEQRNALPLPAQLLQYAGRLVAEKGHGIRYRLISLWPIYRRNGPATAFERNGLETVMANPDEPFTGIVTSGKKRFFQAIYADRAIAEACVVCHNTHPLSPKRDFALNDVMGGIVITIPLPDS
ncbi:MAG: DUF3365 domain-containing protein [Nitrospirae bacterium]|nr:MAG: DUF3365 domain-containing protein [Nitrospirota bacterium]